MKILIACEYSGIVRDAFIKAGYDAISCDILPSESNKGFHIQGDIFTVLENIEDNYFDLIIAHPPCTYLCVAGNRHYSKSDKRKLAISWTEQLWDLCKLKAKRVCFENPVGVLSTQSYLNKPSQYIQPWEYGHTQSKKTGLWLYNLPVLKPTNNVYDTMQNLPDKEKYKVWYCSPSKDRGKIRSRFFEGVASAMVNQWSDKTFNEV